MLFECLGCYFYLAEVMMTDAEIAALPIDQGAMLAAVPKIGRVAVMLRQNDVLFLQQAKKSRVATEPRLLLQGLQLGFNTRIIVVRTG